MRLCFSRFFWLGIGFAGYAWLFEQLQGFAHLDAPHFTGPASATSLFSSLLVGAVLGSLLGLLWIGRFGGQTPSQVIERQLRAIAGIPTWTAKQKQRWIARIYAMAVLAGASAYVSFLSIRELVLGIAAPDNVALAVIAVEVAIIVSALAAFRPCCRGIGAIVARWPPKGAGALLLDPRLHAGLLAAMASAVSAALVVAHWPVVRALPWWSMGILAGSAICGSATLYALSRSKPKVRRAVGIALTCAFALSGAWGFFHEPAMGTPRPDHAPLSRLGHAWLGALLDFDRDAHSSWIGGWDCAPFNPRIHPGAVDLPENAIDENCDGFDAKRANVIGAGTYRHALPEDWRDPPDLYLITIDAFATAVLSSYGGAAAVAPNLDRLAGRAVLFENYFVQGPSTRLSLPSMFTSRFDSQIDRLLVGRFPFELSRSNVMVAEVLAEAGYLTGAVLPHPYFGPENWRGLTQGFAKVDMEAAKVHSAGGAHTARQVTAQTLEFMRQGHKEPLFVWAHYFDAHPPHQVPEGTRRHSEDEQGNEDEESSYAAEISLVDQQVGIVLQEIEARGPNHVVLVTGDHAIAFDHPRHTKQHYAHDLSTLVLHVPLLIYSPRLQAQRVDALASGLDLAPTLANLAGVSRPLPFLGHSLVPLLLGQPSRLPEVRFAQLYIGEDVLRGKDPLRLASARTQQFNMVLDRRTGIVQAWNWRLDRLERRDLWDALQRQGEPKNSTPAGPHPTELRSLRAALEAFVYESHGVSPASARRHSAQLSKRSE